MESGARVVFDSHGGDTTLNWRTGQHATVVRRLTQDEADLDEVGPMWEVKFEDGSLVHVFEDEIKEAD